MNTPRKGPARWIHDRGVSMKITAAVSVAVLVGILVGVLGLKALSASADRTEALYVQNTMGAQLTEELRYHYIAYRLQITMRNTASTPETKQAAEQQVDVEGAAVLSVADKLRTTTRPTPEVLAGLDAFMANWKDYQDRLGQLNQLADSGQKAQYEDYRAKQITPVSNEIVQGCRLCRSCSRRPLGPARWPPRTPTAAPVRS